MINLKKLPLGILLIISFTAFTQPPHGGSPGGGNGPKIGVIKGIVFDDDINKPVEYANVVLHRKKDSSIVTGTITDKEGEFALKELPFGRFFLEVNFIGYNKRNIPDVKIHPQKTELNLKKISLKQAISTIDEVEVTAEQKYVQYKIDRKVVTVNSDLTSAGETAVEVLENTPSVETDMDGNVSLRGSSNFTVLIDGKPSVLEGSEALQQIPAESIENIEIITNPSAKFDPDGVAGIINVVLKKRKSPGLTGLVSASTGTDSPFTGNVLLNYRISKVNTFIQLDYGDRKHPGTMTNTTTTFGTDTMYRIMDGARDRGRGGYGIKGGIEYTINDKNYFTFSGKYGLRNFNRDIESNTHNYTTSGSLNEYYYRENLFNVDHNYFKTSAFYQRTFNTKDHNLQMNLSYTMDDGENNEDIYQTPTNNDFVALNDSSKLQERSINIRDKTKLRFSADYVNPLNEKNKLEAGVQARIDEGVSDYLYENYDFDTEAWNKDVVKSNKLEESVNIFSAYALISGEFVNIGYKLGLRGEYTDRVITQVTQDQDFVVNRFDYFPSIHLSRSLTETLQAQASYSRRINRPSHWFLNPFPTYIDQYTYRVGNPELEPEYTDSYELNLQKRFKNGNFISGEAYYRQTNNLINRISKIDDNGIMVYTFDNIEKDYALGIELMSNVSIFKWWDLNISGNLYNYHVEGEIAETEVNTASETWSGRMSNTFKLKTGTKIQFSGFYMAPSVTAQGERGDFIAFNAAIKQDFFKRKLSVSFNVRDIFGTMNHSFTSSGEGFYSDIYFEHDAPVFKLSLTYRLNNFKNRMQRENFDEGGGGEGDIF